VLRVGECRYSVGWYAVELDWSPDGRWLAAIGYSGPDDAGHLYVFPVGRGSGAWPGVA
jgi:hypothetical protein